MHVATRIFEESFLAGQNYKIKHQWVEVKEDKGAHPSWDE